MPRRRTSVRSSSARWADMSREDYLRAQLSAILKDIDSARDDESWTAVSALHGKARELRRELDEEKTPAATPAEQLDDTALLELLLVSIPELPDAAFARLEDAVALRRTGKPSLRVIAGES
jgi:hypothetical protein